MHEEENAKTATYAVADPDGGPWGHGHPQDLANTHNKEVYNPFIPFEPRPQA